MVQYFDFIIIWFCFAVAQKVCDGIVFWPCFVMLIFVVSHKV